MGGGRWEVGGGRWKLEYEQIGWNFFYKLISVQGRLFDTLE